MFTAIKKYLPFTVPQKYLLSHKNIDNFSKNICPPGAVHRALCVPPRRPPALRLRAPLRDARGCRAQDGRGGLDQDSDFGTNKTLKLRTFLLFIM